MTRGTVVIVTGSPGTGKTTLCAHLARASVRGVHVRSDDFYGYLAHPVSPLLPESHEQNASVIRACTRAAATFAEDGYDVFLDGIFGPWFLPVILPNLSGSNIDYVVLRSDLQQAIDRAGSRSETPANAAIVRHMHAAFATLGSYEPHALDVATRDIAAIAAELEHRRSAGELRLSS